MAAFTDILQQIEGGKAPPPSARSRQPPVPQWEGWIAAILGAPGPARSSQAPAEAPREPSASSFRPHPSAATRHHPTLPDHAETAVPRAPGPKPPPAPRLDLDLELSTSRLRRLTSVELAALRRRLALQLHPDLCGEAARADAMARVNSVIDAELKSRRPKHR
jgi:hypothetical protein